MQFQYEHDIPTIEQATRQAIGAAFSALPDERIEIAEALLKEYRDILTSEMSTLLDRANVAQEWNDGVEQCIQLVEGRL